MRAAKGETRARIWPAAAALLLALLAGSWTPAAASIPSPIDPLATPPPATRLYAQALAAGAEPEPAATADELPQLAAEPPPATSTAGADFSLLDRTPCPERQLEQLAPPRASDDAASYPETRVWGFHLAERTCAWSPGNVSQSRQEGYGKASSETAAGPLEFGYQGMPRDPETGLLYFRNRYYDPELGRFITADPKGYVDGPSMYAFEDDDPANGSDPLGTCDKGQSPGDCIMALEAQQKAKAEREKKTKPILNRFGDWFGDTRLAKAVKQGTDWVGDKIDQASQWVGNRADAQAQKIGGPAAPPSAQAQQLAQDDVINPNTCASGIGCGPLKRAAQQQVGEIANKAATEATRQAIYQAAGVIGGKIGGALEDFAASAAAPDRGGLTKAGRALQKHGSRPGSAFPAPKGAPAELNQTGQKIVEDILADPKSTTTTRPHGRHGTVTEVRHPDGRGVRYDANGKFLGFLEPEPP